MDSHDYASLRYVSPTIVRHINQPSTRRNFSVLVILRVRVRQRQQVVVDLDASDHRWMHRREVGSEREYEVILPVSRYSTPNRRVLVPQRSHHSGCRLQVVHIAPQCFVVDQVVLGDFMDSAGNFMLLVSNDH